MGRRKPSAGGRVWGIFLMMPQVTTLASDFDAIPKTFKACIDDVEYVPIRQPDGAELYVTRHGWAWQAHLQPSVWYTGGRYLNEGKRLRFSTGHVYRMMTHAAGRDLEIVVKISRMAQEVPSITVYDRSIMRGDPFFAEFRTPFDEISNLEKLRSTGVGQNRLRTKRVLAVYTPAGEYEDWQLGRKSSQISVLTHHLCAKQNGNGYGQRIILYPQRDYIVLFQWIHGENAEELLDVGAISLAEMEKLTHDVAQDLANRGFTVLDHKPNHVILRRRKRNGEILQRNGRMIYALADFELLVSM